MNRIMVFAALTAVVLVGDAYSALAHGMSQAKIAELSLHRLERLVVLKKIEDAYQSKLKGLKLELLAHQDEDEPSFKATLVQYPAHDQTQKALEIILNEEGRTLSYSVKQGAEAHGAPSWPDKDPTSLVENALHYVLDGAATKPELAPYDQRLTELSVAQETSAMGALIAVVDILAGKEDPTLRVRIKIDGSFDSAEMIPRRE